MSNRIIAFVMRDICTSAIVHFDIYLRSLTTHRVSPASARWDFRRQPTLSKLTTNAPRRGPMPCPPPVFRGGPALKEGSAHASLSPRPQRSPHGCGHPVSPPPRPVPRALLRGHTPPPA